jgi:dTDP-4-amino-4,6-dideoxygalactose transaminase
MEALGLQGKGVAVPAGVCLDVPLSVHYSGASPVYCDIDLQTLGLSLDTLKPHVDRCMAVLAVHAYGNMCDIQAIEDHCLIRGIPLIEDVALAQGARVGGRPAGSFGAASILSFGAGKVIDVGGGGAVLTDDRALAVAIRQRYRGLPLQTPNDIKNIKTLSGWHTSIYNNSDGRNVDLYDPHFVDAALHLRNAILTRHSWDADGVKKKIQHLAETIARRRELVSQLHRLVETQLLGVRCQPLAEEGVPWRANLFLARDRNRVLRSLLAERMKISSWHPPAQDFLLKPSIQNTPNAQSIGEQILNVWVNEEVDENYLIAVASKIKALTCVKGDNLMTLDNRDVRCAY